MNNFYLHKSIIFLLLFIIYNSAYSQQDPTLSQSFYTKILFNPAASDTNITTLNVSYRKQWIGTRYPPYIGTFSFSRRFKRLNGCVGITAIRYQKFVFGSIKDESLFTGSLNPKIFYSQDLSLANGILSAGISIGVFQQKLDGTFYKGSLVATQSFYIPDSPAAISLFDADIGTAYRNNALQIGLLVTHLAEKPFIHVPVGPDSLFLTRSYYVFGNYHHALTQNINLTENLFINTNLTHTAYDLSLLFDLHKTLYWGVGCRVNDAAYLIVGCKLKQFYLSLSYDYTINNSIPANNGSVESLLRYISKN
jgi:type IX secretion system PorP/SprF family membrane protein